MTAKRNLRASEDAIKKRLEILSEQTQFEADLSTFFDFATEMRAKGACKIMVSRGEGIDYVVEFEAKEEPKQAKDCHAVGFYMDGSNDEEDED